MPERLRIVERTSSALGSLGVSDSSRLLIAVSGGPDSLALAHVLWSLRGEGLFSTVAIAHVNHGIRAASLYDEEVLRKYCEAWKVPLYVQHANTPEHARQLKKGIEETARLERYGFFTMLAKTHGFDFVLTAHTANDQAETILMHLVRGTGVRGLAGIPAKRRLGASYLVRPWLDVTRAEILGYIRESELEPVHDESNEELSYQRNRVRHLVIPALIEAWPERSPIHSIANAAVRMRELERYISAIVAEKLSELRSEAGLLLGPLSALHQFELHSILEAWIAETAGAYSISAREASRIAGWLASESVTLGLRRGIQLRKDGPILKLEAGESPYEFEPFALAPGGAVATPYGEFLLRITRRMPISNDRSVAQFDMAELGGEPIYVRSWQRSDRIAPFGMAGRQRLVSNVLTDAKITGERRRNYPVVVTSGGGILWVPGVRRSDAAPITDRTQQVVEIVLRSA